MMAINAGKLRHRVEFLDQFYMPIENPNRQFWATLKTLQGAIQYQAVAAYQKTTYEVRMRYCTLSVYDPNSGQYIQTPPRSGWYIRFLQGDGNYRDFLIETVLDVDLKHEELQLIVSEA